MYNIVILGASGVGKTAIVTQFVKNYFIDTHDPTMEYDYNKHIYHDGKIYNVNIVDTGGDPLYKSLEPGWIVIADAYLIVYDVTSEKSFEYIKQYSHLKNVLLVGNKKYCNHTVGTVDGREFATKMGWRFMEISAKEEISVFHEIMEMLNPTQVWKNWCTFL